MMPRSPFSTPVYPKVHLDEIIYECRLPWGPCRMNKTRSHYAYIINILNICKACIYSHFLFKYLNVSSIVNIRRLKLVLPLLYDN